MVSHKYRLPSDLYAYQRERMAPVSRQPVKTGYLRVRWRPLLVIDLDKIPNVTLPPEEEEWLTGFTEGDGWVASGPSICYEQKDPRILGHIRSLLSPWSEGSLFPTYWGGWRLAYASKYLFAGLALLLSKHTVTTTWSALLGVKKHTPTLPWIAGFWDAEGWSGTVTGTGLRKNLTVSVSQDDREGLSDIRASIETGSIQLDHLAGKQRHFERNTYTLTTDGHRLVISAAPDSLLVKSLLQYSHHEPKKQELLSHIKLVKEWPDVLTVVRELAKQRRQSAKEGGDANDISL